MRRSTCSKKIATKIAAVAAIVGGLASTPAQAQDWTGFYFGTQGGFGIGDGEHRIVADGFGFLNAPFGTDINGGLWGGQAGFDYQLDQLVFGINGEFNVAWIDGIGDNGGNAFGPGGDDIYLTEMEWLAVVRGRLGFVVPSALNLMIYATGGVAFTEIEAANGDGLNGTFGQLSAAQAKAKETDVGVTVGAGIAWMPPMFAFGLGNVVLTAEYAYYDFGKIRVSTTTDVGVPHVFNVKTNVHTGRVGVAVKF